VHEDYLIDFKDDLKTFGTLIGNISHLMHAAIKNGLDVNWILSGNIPSDIEQIHKKI
jgi:hypothetical protein